MDINEALKARRGGASVDSVLAGLMEGHSVEPTVHDHYRQLCEEDEENGGKGSGIAAPMVTAAKKIHDEDGEQVAGAAVAKMMDELPDGVRAAYDALQGGGMGEEYPASEEYEGGGGTEFDFSELGGMEGEEGEEGAEVEKPEATPEEEEAFETELAQEQEGATEAAGDQGEKNPDLTTPTLKKTESLKRQLSTALHLGEALLRRALRFKAERDHFQSKLGLTESESNLDYACPDGYCYDLRENTCVKTNPRIESLVNTMMMETTDGDDPIDGDKSKEGSDGTTYDAPTGADPGADDPVTGDRAATGGATSGQFMKGGKDPMKEDASPHTFQSMNPGGVKLKQGEGDIQCPEGYVWDSTVGRCVPSTSFSGQEESVEESLVRMGRQHTVNPINEYHAQEPRDWMGRLIESEPQGRKRIEMGEKMQAHRYNINSKKLEARKYMVAEVLENYGVYKGTALTTATKCLDVLYERGLDVATPLLREMAAMAPAGQEGALMHEVYGALGGETDLPDTEMPGVTGGARGMVGLASGGRSGSTSADQF